MSNDNNKPNIYHIYPIGNIQVSDKEQRYILQIDKPYRAGLKQLDQFSHISILWWADQMDTNHYRRIMTCELPYAPGVEAGIFACRSEYRPNPIAVTLTALLSVNVEDGIVVLPWIDAFDGTPVLDIKPYIPVSDRVQNFKVAPWLKDWPEWMEDAAEYFREHATDFGE